MDIQNVFNTQLLSYCNIPNNVNVINNKLGAFILEHVSEIMADICNNNYIIFIYHHGRHYLAYMF